ncbi:hypothetical protein SRIMM317S_05315 [Streptomyces rimosus subsp. rimosus]
MVGTSCGTAPYSTSWSESEAACSLVRGRGPASRTAACSRTTESWSRRAAAPRSPTTAMTGCPPSADGSTFAALSTWATEPRVAFQVRWRVVVPATVTVIGVSGLRPAETSSAAAAATESSEVDTTAVASLEPTSDQQRSSAVRASMNRTSVPSASRSGTPAYAGTPTAAAMPGTTSKTTPSAAHASISSATCASRPGSPDTARTTRLPVRTADMTRLVVSLRAGTPAVVDASSAVGCCGVSTCARACARTTSSTCGSAISTSARASASTARSVSRPGSPGPAPMKVT